ncbi:MAG: hypothetical protein A3I17_03960 [Candidatus Rokubacteria bacterium RIFCSPLOWO2_02_FULL_72_37]|nr:MAG: hypothetical protein A3I17_03960 [Candidatus Rokubacteria bacterium RIFCSPLOWO2_02_FULL_72_37]
MPIGTAAISRIQTPTSPMPARSVVATTRPTRPPPAGTVPRPRDAATPTAACVRSPVAATSRRASPANGSQPRATSGRTNADAPQAPSSSGKRNPA